MQSITGISARAENQLKIDLLTMTEADREALIEQIRECLEQRVRRAKLSSDVRVAVRTLTSARES